MTASPKKENSRDWIALAIKLSVTIMMIIITVLMFVPPFNDRTTWESNPALYGNYGDFIGGFIGTLVSIGTVIFVYITFKNQKQEFFKNEKRQHEFFRNERFESRLYEMIRSNRDMIWNMEYEVPDEYTEAKEIGMTQNTSSNANKHTIIVVRGQKVFVQIHKHIKSAINECEWIFSKYTESKQIFASDELYNAERWRLEQYYGKNIDDDLIFKIHQYSIGYLGVFFGITEGGVEVLRKQLGKQYSKDLIDEVIKTLTLKPAKWSKYWDEYKLLKNADFPDMNMNLPDYYTKPYDKFYGGHHHRLGQYFRHLFAIYNFINEQMWIKHSEKYKYAKMLRSQFSAYEQSVFFYNSLTTMGRTWELDPIFQTLDDYAQIDFRLITKYDIIKNISAEFTGGTLSLSLFYPLVDFEIDNPNLEKGKLKALYK